MLAWLLSAVMTQTAACGSGETILLADALKRAQEFDVSGAIAVLEPAAARCEDAWIASLYLKGWQAAVEAARQGGPEPLLRPARQAAANLESIGGGQPGPAEIARAVLIAAAAAAQTERGEMAIYLTHAVQMEALQFSAQQPGAPAISAHEAAADLLLEVHQYAQARDAYVKAREQVGDTPRVLLGLARSARRLGDRDAACDGYRAFIAAWGSRASSREIDEARSARDGSECSSPATSPVPAPR